MAKTTIWIGIILILTGVIGWIAAGVRSFTAARRTPKGAEAS